MRSRPFVALYIAVFAATMGISMVSPLLPVYAKELGASGVWLGLTFSAFAVFQAIFGPFAGRLSDRYGRKPFIITGLLIYITAALGYLTAQSFYQVIAFRAFSGLGTSLVFSVARAYVGDMTPRGQEGRWLGVFATADIVGFGTGPLVAGLFRELVGFRSVFVAMASLLAFSAFILLIWLPRHSPAELDRRARPGFRREKAVGFGQALRDRLVAAVTANQGLISVSSGATMSFLALRLEDGLGATPILIGLAFATQDLTGGLAQPIFGRMADRYDRRALVAIGLGWNAALLMVLGYVPSYELAVLVLFLMGCGNGMSQVASGALQVVAGRRAGMGTVLGLGSASNGAGIVIGSVAGGVLVDHFGLGSAFLFGGILMAIGVPSFLALTRGVATRETVHIISNSGASAEAAAAVGR
jgi:DHA1 family multidrug resistance protein-like MFS transporter